MTPFYVLAVLGFAVPAVLGFSTGAPEGACFTMTPGHTGGAKQTTASPYKIELNATSLMGMAAIQVMIKGKTNEMFQGFLVQARDESGNIVNGMFSLIGGDTTAQTRTCDGNTANSATHTGATDKASVTLIWSPPSNLDTSKPLMFQATVAQVKMTWWEEIQSVKLTGAAANMVPNLAAMLTVILAFMCLQ